MTGKRPRRAAIAVARLVVVGFDRDDDVEFFGRIIEPFDRRQQSVDRSRFAIERGDHRIDRQRIVGAGRRDSFGRRAMKAPVNRKASQARNTAASMTSTARRVSGGRHDGGGERDQPRRARPTRYVPRQRGGAADSIGRDCLSSFARASVMRLPPWRNTKRLSRSALVKRKRRASAGLFDVRAGDPMRRHAARGDHQTKLIIRPPAASRPAAADSISRSSASGHCARAMSSSGSNGTPSALGKRAQIGLFADRAGGDQHPVGADAERGRTAFGGLDRVGADNAAQAVDFREAMGACVTSAAATVTSGRRIDRRARADKAAAERASGRSGCNCRTPYPTLRRYASSGRC